MDNLVEYSDIVEISKHRNFDYDTHCTRRPKL